MPSKTPAPSTRRRASVPAPIAIRPESNTRIDEGWILRRLGSQSAMVTMIWVLLLMFALGGSLMLLHHSLQLRALSAVPTILQIQDLQIQTQELQLTEMERRLEKIDPTPTTVVTPLIETMPPSAMETNAVAIRIADALQQASSQSPSGTLKRGTTSPDGTKYAGYNDVTPGKRGISVEILDPAETRKIRYIVLFSPSELTGIGTVQEPVMSVRWKDAKTIEYDVLVKKSGGAQEKETRTVEIFY